MEPSPEAIAWGKRQASGSPRWTSTKWNRIGIIFGVELTAEADPDQPDDQTTESESLRDVA